MLEVLMELGQSTRLEGQLERSQALFEEGLELALELDSPIHLYGMQVGLGAVALQRGELTAAATWLEQGLALRTRMGLRRVGGYGITLLGQVAYRQGDLSRSTTLAAQSLTIHRDNGSREGVVASLELLASISAAREQPERALRLLGTAHALLASTDSSLVDSWLGLSDRAETLQMARERIGEVAFAPAWAAGQTLTVEQAVAEALEGA